MTQHAVDVQRDVRMGQCAGVTEGGQRQQFVSLPQGVHRMPDGQHHAAAASQRFGHQAILLRVVVRLGHQQVVEDRSGAGLGQSRDHLRMDGPPPGPAAHGLEARIVDGHDDDVLGGWMRPGRLRGVVNRLVQAPGPVSPTGPGREQGQRQTQPAPFTLP
nr:hypothetical protein [uncultured Aquabacterium sp.]